jgi:hypothetical protein
MCLSESNSHVSTFDLCPNWATSMAEFLNMCLSSAELVPVVNYCACYIKWYTACFTVMEVKSMYLISYLELTENEVCGY